MTARNFWRQLGNALTHSGPSYQPTVRPCRGDQFDQWLKAQRDQYSERHDTQWDVINQILDDYRLHADTGTPLDQHVCEGGNIDDCYGCHQQEQQR